MKIENISDEEREAVVSRTVHEAERQAFLANLGVAIGAGSAERAKQLAEIAKGAKKAAADDFKLRGPFLTDDEKRELVALNIAECERAYLEHVVRKAGGDPEAEPQTFEARKERLEALTI